MSGLSDRHDDRMGFARRVRALSSRARARAALAAVWAGATIGAALPGGSGLAWALAAVALAAGMLAFGGLSRRNAELRRELEESSLEDQLTGLLNRRGFERRLAQEVARARRTGRPVSLIACDLDRFKRVNEYLGHSAGDRVLQRVANIFSGELRAIDTIGRVGGAAFLFIVPEADEQGGYAAAERLRKALHSAYQRQVSASFGVACAPTHADEVEKLLRAGEEALFAAKELGRDRTVIFTKEVAGILARATARRTGDSDVHLATILTLAETLDLRDPSTARHSETVGRYSELMARELGLPPAKVERVRLAGILHDVGKIGVRDSVLMKPGPLDDDEWVEMRKHPEIGARIVGSAELDDIRGWILAHHERPDGRGYPFGLGAAEIPLEAKILAVADSFEAMTAERWYKSAMSHDEACAELRRCAGTQFDEAVVAGFLRLPDHEYGAVEPQWTA